jgi:hypothetical protein
MCDLYWRRHGVERPAAPSQFPTTLRPCTLCGRPTRTPRRGWCSRCYYYWWHYDIERPQRPCLTCGQLVPGLHCGRCNPCYQYWHRTGRERPARLWQR